MEQHAAAASRDAIDERRPLTVRGWRSILRGIALLATAICGVWWLIALVRSASAKADVDSFRNAANARNCLTLALIFWVATSDLILKVARVDWRSWGWRRGAVLAVLCVHVVLVFRTVLYYPEHAIISHWLSVGNSADRIKQSPDEMPSVIDEFAARCRRELPPDARILFHGSQEGSVFAYEVYPRKVFRLPNEGFELGATIESRRCVRGFPSDPVEAFWHCELPLQAADREAFIRAHGITHEVFYQAEHTAECRWEKVR